MLLVFEHLLSQLVALVEQNLVLLFQFFVLSFGGFSRKELLYFVREVLIEVFGHLQLLLDNLKLVLQGFVQAFVLDVFGFEAAVAVAARVVFAI